MMREINVFDLTIVVFPVYLISFDSVAPERSRVEARFKSAGFSPGCTLRTGEGLLGRYLVCSAERSRGSRRGP